MRVAIVGDRRCTDKKFVLLSLADIFDQIKVEPQGVAFITGGAKTGVDSFIAEYAEKVNIPHIQFEPHFVVDKHANYTPRDFFTRNRQIVSNCDILVAFVHEEDTGTKHIVSYADKKDKAVFTVPLLDKHVEVMDEGIQKRA